MPRGRISAIVCLAVAFELLAYGHGIQPTVPDQYFTDAGPAARFLQKELGGHRYALSPQAALLSRQTSQTIVLRRSIRLTPQARHALGGR